MTVTTFASGSSGNCYLISQGSTHIIVDAGISCRRITDSLASVDLSPSDLAGILITHEHTDHICGLSTLLKKTTLPVWCSTGTGKELARTIPGISGSLRTVCPETSFLVGDITVMPFSTSHDAAESLGFTLTYQNHKVSIATDLGMVSESVLHALADTQLLIAEANHDAEMLRSGPYPPALQDRISGHLGHLSNADCAEMCAKINPQIVLLAHISEKNNTSELALKAVREALGPEVLVEVIPRGEPGKGFHLS